MKVKYRAIYRCLALLLCIVMVASLLPEMTVSAALDTPKVSVKKSGSSLKVTWKPITGAVKYRVFRKGPSDSNWKTLATVASSTTSYSDSNVKNGTTYKYTVRCVSKDGKTFTSDYNHSGVSATYWTDGTPSVKVSVVDNGLKITWGAVSGAKMYRVFREKEGGGWATLTYTTGTSYVDISVSPGKTYKYTVRCCTADKKTFTSDYNHNGVKATYTRNFAITGLESVDGGVKITWSKKIDTAVTYKIERIVDQEWRQIGSTSSLTFTDKGADFEDGLANNTTYKYRISYTVGGSKEVTPEKSITYFETPELQDIVVDQGKFTVKWKAVQGATKYRVFRRQLLTDKWTTLADVTGTSYTDTTVASGLNYYYTVRCLGANGQFISGYKNPGKIADYIGMPTLIKTTVENDGVHFQWNTVGGVTKYQVYRKTPSTSWAKYDGVQTATGEVGEYIDTTATSGQTYYYTVACSDGSDDISDYDTKGLACKKLANPPLKKIAILEKGIEVTWEGVDTATKYRVFRKEASGTTWKKLGDTTGLTYLDTTVVNKGSYIYTVRVLGNNGYASGYNTTGISATFYTTPVLYSAKVTESVSSGNGTIDITWKAVEGVSKYSIYRRYIKRDGTLSAWVNLTHSATGTSYRDTPPESSFTYIYTVRCSNGSKPISYYNGTGVRTYFLMTPQLVNPSVGSNGITVKWKYVDGAKGYKVYRKVAGGGWHTIATINAATTLTFLDARKNLVAGQEYIYTVRAIRDDNISGYLNQGIKKTA